MIQSGILYTIDSTTGQSTNKPLKGAWINFVQNDVIKVRTQTHSETGAYSVDVPFGKYTVNLAVGNVTVTMRAGQLFELKSGDNANAFQNWLYSTTADVDDTLLNSFKQIANDISDSANRAENAATEAQQIQQQMQNNSIGNAIGKWLKEGAFGIAGYRVLSFDDLNLFFGGLTFNGDPSSANSPFNRAGAILQMGAYRSTHFQLHFGIDGLVKFRKGGSETKDWGDIFEFYTTKNTTVDNNGNIKKASPIIKLFDDHIEWNQDFKEEPVFEKLDIGVYKISNTNGLARGIVHGDWYIETPKNRNGLPYFMVEWEQDAITDDVVIKVFDRKFDINIGDFINGEPRDIGKDERWIDLRFHEQIYSLTNELPDINVPYHELWGVDPYIPQVVEQTEEDMALEDQRAF